jgi:hypothetical protein
MRFFWCKFILHQIPSVSVPDPDLNPNPDPYVFGRPGSGSGSFYQQAEIVRKTLIPTGLLLLLDSSSLKNDVNVPSKSNKQKIFLKNIFFGLTKIAEAWIRGSGSGSTPKCHGS